MLIQADARQIPLADGCVQCVVTSPPYFGLRDYGTANQIGLEPTPDAFVAALVGVFREVRRVLKDDGTVWLNLGDSYAAGKAGRTDYGTGDPTSTLGPSRNGLPGNTRPGPVILRSAPEGLKPKDLIGIPWRVAFALQADGWYLRSDVIWHKPNPMPESVTDRPTKAHEYLFLLAKGSHSRRSIQIADLKPERVHLRRDIWSKRAYAGTTGLCIAIASALFDVTQAEHDFSLPAFDAKEWKQCPQHGDSDLVASLPAKHRTAAYAARFLDGETSTKEFLCEIDRLWRDLADADHLLIRRRLVECALAPGVFVDSDGAIGINDAGKVSKVDFTHHQIIDTVPTGCTYFYDAAAIKEPVTADMARRAEAGHTRGQGKVDASRNDATTVRPALIEGADRNKRSVWTVPTMPYSGAHFATMPEKLVEPCILAGSRLGDRVLDTFMGSGTVGAVAERLGRRWVGLDLNPAYHQLAKKRTAQRGLKFGS